MWLHPPDIAYCLGCGGGGSKFGSGRERQDTFVIEEVVGTLNANGKAAGGSATQQDAENGMLVAHTLKAEGFDASEDGTGRGVPLVPVAFTAKDYGADAGNLAPTMRAMGHAESHANGGGQVAVAIPINTQNCTRSEGYGKSTGVGVGDEGDPAFTLQAEHQHGVAVDVKHDKEPKFGENLCPTLQAADGGSGCVSVTSPYQTDDMFGSQEIFAVRRLTPYECHLLQSFPGDHCAVTITKGKRQAVMADGPQYKMLGNSMNTLEVGWPLARLVRQLEAAKKGMITND